MIRHNSVEVYSPVYRLASIIECFALVWSSPRMCFQIRGLHHENTSAFTIGDHAMK
jgi:hypothetical protein